MAARIRSLRNGLDPVIEASRDDLVPGDLVTVSALDAATTYFWAIAFAPEGSTATFSGSPSAVSPGTFTVDLEGPYLIRLIVDAGLPTEDTQYVRLRALTEFAALHLVAAGERRDTTGIIPVDVDVEGWANEQNSNLQTLKNFIKPYAQSGRFLQVDANDGTQGYGDFPTIQAAINYAESQGASPGSQWLVAAHPGQYIEDLTLKPFIHLVGWPGEVGTGGVTTVRGNHTVALPNAADRMSLWAVALTVVGNNTVPVLTKSGPGVFIMADAGVYSLGNDVAQGACLDVQGGYAVLDRSVLVQQASTLGRSAIIVNDGVLEANRCQVEGAASAVVVNPAMLGGIRTLFKDCILRGVQATVVGVCDSLELVRCTSTSSGTGVGLYVRSFSGVPYVNPVLCRVVHSSIGNDIVFDTTNLTNTAFHTGSVEYGTVTYPAGAPGTVRAVVQSTTNFYDNTTSGLTAENVQDALDEIAAVAAIAPLVYSKNMPEVPDDVVRYRGWAPIACELVAVRVRMMTLNTQGNYRLFVTNNATGNTVLSAAFFDMNTLVAGTIQPVGLTAAPADLTFATLDAWTIALVSDDPNFDGEAVYVELVFNPATAAAALAADLATTLLVGNITGGSDIVMTTGDEIVGQTDVILRSTGAGSNIELFPDAAGAVVINGKLTVTGLIDPTGLVLSQAGVPATSASEGALFVSDGSGGLVAGNLYYAPASGGTPVDLLSGGGGGDAPVPLQFIWRPGGVGSGNVYASFAALYAALSVASGRKELIFDNSISGNPMNVPVGTYDFTDTKWKGLVPGAYAGFDPAAPQVQFSNGTQITNLREIEGLFLQWSSNRGVPPFLYNSGATEFLYLVNTFIAVTIGAIPIVGVFDGLGGPTQLVVIGKQANLGGFNQEWLVVAGTSQVNFVLSGGSQFRDDSASGPAGTQLDVNTDTTSQSNAAQPNFAGTKNFNLTNEAKQLGYLANGSGGNWAGAGIPPDVEEALDRLTNFIASFHGPIP